MTEVNIGDEWELWNSLKHLNLPIADPSILLDITTSVSAPLHGHIEYLEVEDLTTKETRRAYNFDGVASQTSYDRFFPNVLPLDAPIGSTVTNTLAFGSNNGALGSLFEIRPDIVRYEYYIDTWEGSPIMKQHRLTKDTRVSMDAHITVPFTFHEGLRLSYGDTADVNFEKIALDSLINNVEMIDSLTLNDLKLVLTAQSWIPFDISGTVTFLDENGKDLGITVNDSNIIKINGPIDYNGSLVNTPGESVLIIDVDQDDLDKLSKTRQLIYSLDMRDVDVSKLKNKGAVFPVSLAEYTKLRIKVALSADVKAYLKLQFN